LQSPLPSIQLPKEDQLDVADLSAACIERLAVLIKSLAGRDSEISLEIVEVVLSLKDCSSRLNDWNASLSGLATLIESPSQTPGLIREITKTLVRLASKLMRLNNVVTADDGMYNTHIPRTTTVFQFHMKALCGKRFL
jgi:hypothetical protein